MRGFVIGFLFLAACGGGDDGPTGMATITVTHYDFAIDLTSHAAQAKVTATVTAAGNCYTLPVRAQLDTTTVTVDGEAPKSGALANGAITACGASHDVGDTVVIAGNTTIALATLETSQVGFSVTNDADGNPFTYLVSWVNGCDQFSPCDARPDQFATYTFDVTHDAGLTVRCPGTIAEPSATETTCDFEFAGGPTYSTFGIAAYPTSAWPMTDEGMWGDVHVTLYDRTDTDITAAVDPAYHDGFIRWMESEFGPFPFGTELRLLTAPTYWDGFEHPGNIVLDDGLAHENSPYADVVAHTIDHEMAHQWAGDQTTLADTYDFAWKESMAEYLAFVYEDMNDHASALKTAQTWKADSAAVLYYPVPDDHPALFDYYADVYGAGPQILFRQLEVRSSRAQVLAALQDVLGSQRALSMDTLTAALEQHTGLDLTNYWATWLHGTGKPVWPKVRATFADGMLHVTQTNAGAASRTCMFHVALNGGTGETLSVAVDLAAGQDQMIAAAPTFAVATVKVDPESECIVYVDNSTAREGPRANPWRSARGAAMDAASSN
ncbi:MAG TPA: M1 family aminopeptidase [Kofleriaceae bacterium]|jgi:aminopeptidase N